MANQNCHEKWLPNRLEPAGCCTALNPDVDSKGAGFVFNGVILCMGACTYTPTVMVSIANTTPRKHVSGHTCEGLSRLRSASEMVWTGSSCLC